MNSCEENESASPVLRQAAHSRVLATRFGHGGALAEFRASSMSSSQSDLSQELRRLGVGMHSRNASKESELSGQTSFNLRDISNSKDFLHRRTASKLLTFEQSSSENFDFPSAQGSKASILVHSATQSYSHLLGSLQRLEQDSKEGSMALISEFPSSLCEDSRPESYRSVAGGEGKEGSTILSNLSSDSSRAQNREEDFGTAVYISAADVPLREALEINLFDGELKSSVPEGELPLPRKVYCPDCDAEVVPILSFQPCTETWWERLLHIGQTMKCCHDARPPHEDVVHICRKCAKELHRSQAR